MMAAALTLAGSGSGLVEIRATSWERELRGNLAAMLGATVQTKRSPESDDLSLQVSLVAGGGFEPPTFGL